MALLHRVVALVCVRSLVMERWIAGREIEFARDGALDHTAMRNALVTMEDLRKEMRKRLGHEDTRPHMLGPWKCDFIKGAGISPRPTCLQANTTHPPPVMAYSAE